MSASVAPPSNEATAKHTKHYAGNGPTPSHTDSHQPATDAANQSHAAKHGTSTTQQTDNTIADQHTLTATAAQDKQTAYECENIGRNNTLKT